MKLKESLKIILTFALCLSMTACGIISIPDGGGPNPPAPSIGTGGESDESIADTNIVFTEGGKSDYKIVVPEETSQSIEYAASELQKYVLLSTGAKLSIETDENVSFNTSLKIISLGNTTIYDECGMTGLSYQEMNRDGFKIYRYGNTIVINSPVEIGVTYGVQEFLAYMLDWRAYAGDEIQYTKTTDKVFLKDFALTEIPDFNGRDIDGVTDYNVGAGTALRISGDAKHDDYVQESTPHHAETFYQLIPRSVENKETHPEWFEKAAVQFCFNQESAIDYIVEKSIYYLTEVKPTAKYLHISPCDGGGYCTCKLCKAEQKTYGYTGHLIIMVNKVIEKVETWRLENCPDRQIEYVTLAYTGCLTFNPPLKLLVDEKGSPILDENGQQQQVIIDEKCRPHEKLYIQITPLDYCFSHAWTDPKCAPNAAYYSSVKGWSLITDRFFAYDYGITFTNYFRFFDNYSALQPNLAFYKQIGIKRIFRQAATGATWYPFSDLQTYLFGKLTWDCEQNTEDLINDFMDNYYKEAAPYIKEYFYLMRTHIAVLDQKNANGSTYSVHFLAYKTSYLENASGWTKKLFDQCSALIEKAKAACDLSTPEGVKIYNRVVKESMGPRFMELQYYSDYYPNFDKSIYLAKVSAFERDTITAGVAYWRERKQISLAIEDFRAAVD